MAYVRSRRTENGGAADLELTGEDLARVQEILPAAPTAAATGRADAGILTGRVG